VHPRVFLHSEEHNCGMRGMFNKSSLGKSQLMAQLLPVLSIISSFQYIGPFKRFNKKLTKHDFFMQNYAK
jgi:hypothetical protein